MAAKLIIVGAGGHGRVCAEIAKQSGRFGSVVYSDSEAMKGSTALGLPVAYTDDELLALERSEVRLFLGVGQTDTGARRAGLFERFFEGGFCIRRTSVGKRPRGPERGVG